VLSVGLIELIFTDLQNENIFFYTKPILQNPDVEYKLVPPPRTSARSITNGFTVVFIFYPSKSLRVDLSLLSERFRY